MQVPIVVWILIGTVAILTFLTTSMKFDKKIYAISGIHMSDGKGRVLGIIFGSMTFTIIDKIYQYARPQSTDERHH